MLGRIWGRVGGHASERARANLLLDDLDLVHQDGSQFLDQMGAVAAFL